MIKGFDMNKIILFDFFGVISSEIAPFWFRRHFDDAEADRVKMEIVTPADRGDINESELFTSISDLLGVEPSKTRQEWMELVNIDEQLIEYIRELKKTHRVYLLSNAIGSFIREILDKYSLYSLFDDIFISSDIHLIKPDEDYFNYCLDRIGANPADCVFTDDNIKNVMGAVAVGINAIHYTSFIDYKRELEKIL